MRTLRSLEVFRFKINFCLLQHYTKVNVNNETVRSNVLFRNRPSHSSKTLNVVPFLQQHFSSFSIPKLFFSTRWGDPAVRTLTAILTSHTTVTNLLLCVMDPQLVTGLLQIKDFLIQGIFTQQEFDDQKRALMTLYPVARSAPLTVGIPRSPVSQPLPLKVISDAESRDPMTGRHRFGIRKCCKCPLLECY